tara:strand:+ start:270 stop:431 length:162 start_codon:yes stop_codon:yes gene_type:complete
LKPGVVVEPVPDIVVRVAGVIWHLVEVMEAFMLERLFVEITAIMLMAIRTAYV